MPDQKSTPDRQEDIYASPELLAEAPEASFPGSEMHPRNAFSLIRDELMLDGNSRQNLATFCQTWGEPELHRLMQDCVDKNMVDKDEYPQTAEIESRCIRMLQELWHAPVPEDRVGTSTVGSSEAAMLGGLAMKRRWQARQAAAGRPAERPNLVTGPVQVCWHKFTRYWDVELREIPMAPGRLLMTPDEVLSRCDENTIGVVPTLGVTFTGGYEPVADVAAALDRLQADSGLDIPIHVDAASGGFLAPFCAPELVWDFRLPRVRSINASGHKFGLSPLGVGWIGWRDQADLPDDLVFWVNYLGGNMRDIALNFSRPGGQVICQYYNFIRLGREGYAKIHEACYKTAAHLAERLSDFNHFEVVFDGNPARGIPAVSWRLRDGLDPGYSLFDLADRLRTRGWQVPAYALPSDCQDVVIQRALIRHGVSRDLIGMLIDHMGDALRYFENHPVSAPLTSAEASGFNHGMPQR